MKNISCKYTIKKLKGVIMSRPKKNIETVKFLMTLPNQAMLDEWKAMSKSLTICLADYVRLTVNADIQNRRLKDNSDKSVELIEMMKKMIQEESKKKK